MKDTDTLRIKRPILLEGNLYTQNIPIKGENKYNLTENKVLILENKYYIYMYYGNR